MTSSPGVAWASPDGVPGPEPFLFYGYRMKRVMSVQTYDLIMTASLVAAEVLCLMGVATNIINIVVFVKLGLKESTSISMMTLAISDLLICVLGLWSALLYTPSFRNSDLPFRAEDIFILTGGVTRVVIARTSALITSYIAVERCLCVMFPLKVKSLITRRRTVAAMVTMFAITLGPSIFVFFNYRFRWRFYPDVNKTLLGVTYIWTDTNNMVDKVINLLFGPVYLISAFLVISVCTVYLIVHLSRASRWRRGHSSATKTTVTSAPNATSTTAASDKMKTPDGGQLQKKQDRTDRAARTVVVITVVFIACFLPGFFNMTLYSTMPGFTLYGPYGMVFQLMQGILLFTESINSAVNLFIYYTMGTSFRNMLHSIFRVGPQSNY